MLYIALAELCLLALTIFAAASFVRSLTRAHARREDLLMNQALHAAGRPWQPAPAENRPVEEPDWDELLSGGQYARFTLSPEQEP